MTLAQRKVQRLTGRSSPLVYDCEAAQAVRWKEK
jgi:hypothetical protein